MNTKTYRQVCVERRIPALFYRLSHYARNHRVGGIRLPRIYSRFLDKFFLEGIDSFIKIGYNTVAETGVAKTRKSIANQPQSATVKNGNPTRVQTAILGRNKLGIHQK